MLIHDAFHKALTINSNEHSVDQWIEYDYEYLHRMKRYLKQQLVEQFADVKGKRFLIERPAPIRKQIPLMMAIWELGGIVVVYDLHYILMKNPLYKDFNSNIDIILIEHGDQEFSNVGENLQSMEGRIYELKYFDQTPEFFTAPETPVVANEDDIALVVYSSGTVRTPVQMPYTHKQVLACAMANIRHFDYQPTEHIYHFKSFHHGGMVVNYLIATLIAAPQHYFKSPPSSLELVADFISQMLAEVPVNRLLFTFELSDNLIDNLSLKKSMAEHLTIICTHWISDEARMDRLFSTGQVSRFISPFGCRELLSCLMQHDITPDSWANRGLDWNPAIFERVQDDFWEYKEFDGELGVRAPWSTDFYIPGDRIEHVSGRSWRWLGRNTQIKREGMVVVPDAVDGIIKTEYSKFDPLVVADYQHKKLYCIVYNNPTGQTDNELLTVFNTTIDQRIDYNHLLDLVMYLPGSTDAIDKYQVDKGRSDPSLSVLRYIARQRLGLDTDV
jgi:hypothetical protein